MNCHGKNCRIYRLSRYKIASYQDTRPLLLDLLPQIDDLAELKLTLHCFWLLNEQNGEYRYLRGEDLRSDRTLLASLNLDSELRTPQVALTEALSSAVARNTLLRMEIDMTPDQPNGPEN